MDIKYVIVSKCYYFAYNFLAVFFTCKIVVDNKKAEGLSPSA